MNYNITNRKDLDRAILLLGNELDEQKKLLTSQFNVMHESFNPFAFVSDIFKDLITSEKFRNNVLKATIGFTAGYYTKKLLFGKSKNPINLFLGNLLQYSIASIVTRPAEIFKKLLPLLDFFNKKPGAGSDSME